MVGLRREEERDRQRSGEGERQIEDSWIRKRFLSLPFFCAVPEDVSLKTRKRTFSILFRLIFAAVLLFLFLPCISGVCTPFHFGPGGGKRLLSSSCSNMA